MMNRLTGVTSAVSGDATRAPLSAAESLVQRTLAQHGLSAGPSGGVSMPAGLGSAMQGFMSQMQGLAGGMADTGTRPSGSDMGQGSFTCPAGSRNYRVHVPKSADQGITGLVVMLHGCTQNPVDFAAGTGMNALADKHGFVVLYPEQSRGDNAQSCWNWFSLGDQRRDRGEPAILAGMTRQIAEEHGVPEGKIFVAGLSAGAAMAVILGETYPDLYTAVGAHSGLPYGAARDVPSAFAAMSGNGPDVAAPVAGTGTVRTIVFHGSADSTVVPANGARIYRHALNRGAAQTFHDESRGTTAGRGFERKTVTDGTGTVTLDYWSVDGLGHAWSGGQAAGSFTDAKGPDASAEMVAFFLQTEGAN